MPACPGAAGHGSCNRSTFHFCIERGQITEILKCLGIAFADDIRILISIKHPDQLPGITIRGVIIVSSRMIILGFLTNICFIRLDLFIVMQVTVFGNDCLGICSSCLCRSGFIAVRAERCRDCTIFDLSGLNGICSSIIFRYSKREAVCHRLGKVNFIVLPISRSTDT